MYRVNLYSTSKRTGRETLVSSYRHKDRDGAVRRMTEWEAKNSPELPDQLHAELRNW